MRKRLAAVEALPLVGAQWLAAERGLRAHLPALFAHDRTTSVLGRGEEVFAHARKAFQGWSMFDLGWVRVANPEARIERGAAVAVEAHTLGLWTLNVSRIVEVVDRTDCFGFIYATSTAHVEYGEERFLVTRDADGEVRYALEAVSRPRATLAWLGYPATRHFQRRFARASHARMQAAVAAHYASECASR